MKNIIISFCLMLIAQSAVLAQNTDSLRSSARLENEIAKFWFVMIKTGPAKDIDSATKARLFIGHMDNINRLHKQGILKVAGPFDQNKLDWRGIFILDCASLEEAQHYVQTDPAVAAGIFLVEIVPWYTSPIGSFTKANPK